MQPFDILETEEHITCNHKDVKLFENSCIKNKYQTGITVLHLNIRSIRINWDNFCIMFGNSIVNIFDVMIFTEVNVKDDLLDLLSLFRLSNFCMFHNLRKGKKGGGILIFVKENIKVEEKPCNSNHFESAIISIKKCNIDLNIIAVYRPPSKSEYYLYKSWTTL